MMSNKKKRYLLITIIIIVLCAVFVFMLTNHTIAKMKGNSLWGNDKCNCPSPQKRASIPVGMAYTEWKCEICGYQGSWCTTGVPEICSECAEKTNRCQWCGKKK